MATLSEASEGRLRVLQQRVDFLTRKIEQVEKETPGRPLGHLRNERATLVWALKFIRQAGDGDIHCTMCEQWMESRAI